MVAIEKRVTAIRGVAWDARAEPRTRYCVQGPAPAATGAGQRVGAASAGTVPASCDAGAARARGKPRLIREGPGASDGQGPPRPIRRRRIEFNKPLKLTIAFGACSLTA
jgi:hypothetical protein